ACSPNHRTALEDLQRPRGKGLPTHDVSRCASGDSTKSESRGTVHPSDGSSNRMVGEMTTANRARPKSWTVEYRRLILRQCFTNSIRPCYIQHGRLVAVDRERRGSRSL